MLFTLTKSEFFFFFLLLFHVFLSWQIKLQESPEDRPAGQTPHTTVVYAHNDLVDKVQPGDRVNITGTTCCHWSFVLWFYKIANPVWSFLFLYFMNNACIVASSRLWSRILCSFNKEYFSVEKLVTDTVLHQQQQKKKKFRFHNICVFVCIII